MAEVEDFCTVQYLTQSAVSSTCAVHILILIMYCSFFSHTLFIQSPRALIVICGWINGYIGKKRGAF